MKIFSTLARLILVVMLGIILPDQADPALSQKSDLVGASIREIKAKTFEMDNKQGVAVYSTDVKAVWDDITLECRRLEVYYENASGTQGLENVQGSIKKIIATGDVKITRSDDGIMATAEKVEYSAADEKVYFTGSPALRQGNNIMEGSKITFDRIEEKIFIDNVKSFVSGDERK